MVEAREVDWAMGEALAFGKRFDYKTSGLVELSGISFPKENLPS